MQQIYKRTPMPKRDFNKVTKQLYWNHTSGWVFSCKFAHVFGAPSSKNTSGWLLLWRPLKRNKIQTLFHSWFTRNYTFVPTLPFWTGGSRLERTAPAIPVLPEIFRVEMILAAMPDIYEFFKSVTLFTYSMWKPWVLITKLDVCVAPAHHLHSQF